MSGTKAQLEDTLDMYRSHIKTLEGLVADLRQDKIDTYAQVQRLQDALIAVSSPEAYYDQRMDKLGTPDHMSSEDKKKSALVHEIEEKYIRSLEDDMFKSGDDLVDSLSRMLMIEGTRPGPALHGNDES